MDSPVSDNGRARLVRLAVIVLVVATSMNGSAWAQDAEDSIGAAVRNGNVDLELLYRYEFVDSDAFALHANASLLRTRLGYVSAAYRGFTVGLEVDDLRAIVVDDFNSTRNGRLDRPVVADPNGTEINQAYVAYRTAADTHFGIGRQRITVPRRRFVASLNWRLNEQTFDTLTATHAFSERLTVDYAYVWNVNRLFGPDSGSPPADLGGAMHFLDGRYAFDSGAGLHGYGYFLDFDDAPDLSSATVGLLFSASLALSETLSLPYSIEVARQSDYANNPVGYHAGYINLQAGLTATRLRVTASFERLDGDGTPGHVVTTPLAGLNGMNGWADQFLTIPDDGLEDRTLQVTFPFWRGELSISAHDYTAAHGPADYGDELDLALSWPIAERYSLLVRIADYRARDYATDTMKAWLMLTARF